MKTLSQISLLVLLVFSVCLVNGQEQKKIENTITNKSTIAAPDSKPNGGDLMGSENKTPDKTGNTNAALTKKGYDHYKAKSDPGSVGSGTKAQDHNSSRSNKTSSKINQGGGSGVGELDNKGIDDKTDKSEAARAKKK